MPRSISDSPLLSALVAIVPLVAAVGLGPLWVPIWVAGSGFNLARRRRFLVASWGAEARRVAVDESGLRLGGPGDEPPELLAYPRIARARWWVQVTMDGGFASGHDSRRFLLEIEEIDGRRRSWFITPELASSSVKAVLGPLMDRGQLARRPLDGGKVGVGLAAGLLLIVTMCGWCAVGLAWYFRHAGADWPMTIVGGWMGIVLGVVLVGLIMWVVNPS